MLQSLLSACTEPALAWAILLRVSVLLAIAWLVHLMLRSGNPYRRLLLWRSAAVVVIATPLLMLVVPKLSVSMSAQTRTTESSHPHSGGGWGSQPEESLVEAPSLTVISASGSQISPAALAAALHPDSAEVALRLQARRWLTAHWSALLGGVWAGGVVVLAVRWRLAWLRLRRVIAGSIPADPRCRLALERLARMCGCKTETDLRVVEGLSSPMLAGIRKPLILLPAHMSLDRESTELGAVLTHELTHLNNRDLAWMAILRVIAVALWWHPLCWRMCRAHEQACEEACDSAAAEYMGDWGTYARTLARIALSGQRPVPALAGISMAGPAQIVRRLSRLNARSGECSRPGRTTTGLAAGAWGASALALSSVQLVALALPPAVSESGGRVLRFPAERSLGQVYIQDGDAVEAARLDVDEKTRGHWELLGEARGDLVIPANKRVHLMIEREGFRYVSALSRLAPDDLYQLSFSGSGLSAEQARERGLLHTANAKDTVMPHVARLTGLKVLMLNLTDVTSKGLRHIEGLQALECLYLPRGIDDSAMEYVAGLTGLKRLHFSQNDVTDQGVARLSALSNLEELEIGGAKMSDDALAFVGRLTGLKSLNLWSNAFSGEGMKHLESLGALEALELFKTQEISDDGLASVGKISSLQYLSLPWMKQITDQGVAHLSGLGELRTLKLRHTSMTDAGAEHLQKLKKLEVLEVPEGLGEAALAGVFRFLAGLKKVELFGSSGSMYSDDLLEVISGLSELEVLLVSGKLVTDEGMAHISRCRKLRELSVFYCPITDRGLSELVKLGELERLAIYGARLTTSGVSRLSKLQKLSSLRISKISPGPQPLDISGLVNLRELTVGSGPRGDGLRDEDLACLAGLKNLRWFQMEYCRGLSDAGLAHLADLTQLTRLSIGDQITDAGLGHLAKLKQLESLTIHGHLTEQGLRQLEQNTKLANLWVISPEPVSEGFVRQLRAQLPRLSTIRCGRDLNSMRAVGMAGARW